MRCHFEHNTMKYRCSTVTQSKTAQDMINTTEHQNIRVLMYPGIGICQFDFTQNKDAPLNTSAMIMLIFVVLLLLENKNITNVTKSLGITVPERQRETEPIRERERERQRVRQTDRQ